MEAFNLPAMTRISVGPAWTQIPAGEQQALIRASPLVHRHLSPAASTATPARASRLRREHPAERRPAGPHPAEPAARRAGALNYLLRDFGGAWRVVDIYLERHGQRARQPPRRIHRACCGRAAPPRLEAELRRRTEALAARLTAPGPPPGASTLQGHRRLEQTPIRWGHLIGVICSTKQQAGAGSVSQSERNRLKDHGTAKETAP